jgi:hypothetical protein
MTVLTSPAPNWWRAPCLLLSSRCTKVIKSTMPASHLSSPFQDHHACICPILSSPTPKSKVTSHAQPHAACMTYTYIYRGIFEGSRAGFTFVVAWVLVWRKDTRKYTAQMQRHMDCSHGCGNQKTGIEPGALSIYRCNRGDRHWTWGSINLPM